jgi:TRAP-type transport system small permease protein
MVVMVAMVFGNVVLRYLFDSGITASEEVSRFIFVWLTFGGAVLAFATGGHIAMDTLISHLPQAWKKLCALISNLGIIGCCGFMLVGGWKQTVINWVNVAPVSGLPKGAIYISAVVAAIAIGLMAIKNLWLLFSGTSADELAQQSVTE